MLFCRLAKCQKSPFTPGVIRIKYKWLKTLTLSGRLMQQLKNKLSLNYDLSEDMTRGQEFNES